MTTETRYKDLLGNIPKGDFYDANGFILPHRDGSTTFRLVTEFPNDTFRILINSVDNGIVTTDVNGNAIFDIILPKDEVVLELQRQNSIDKIISYFTVRDSATIIAAIAEQIEGIDDSIDNTLDSFYLARAGSGDIDLAHGLILQYPNAAIAELEAYREMLQIVRQAERQFGGRLSGKYAVIAALTQVNPFILDRYITGPRWILGYDKLPNSDLSLATRFPTGALSNINFVGQFVTLNSVNNYTNIGSTTLQYKHSFKRLVWNPPNIGSILVSPAILSESLPMLIDGKYTTLSGKTVAILTSLNISSVTSPSSGEFDHLYFEFNDRGIIAANLSLGFGLSIADKLKGYVKSHSNYRDVRLINTPISGSLVDEVFVISVSDATPIGTGTIEHVSGNDFKYTAPGDSAGIAVTIVPGEIVVLSSANTDYYVNVLMSYVISSPATTTDTFNIANRYGDNNNIALSADNIDLLGNPLLIAEEEGGKVKICDGPANYATFPIQAAHRGLFDIPKVTTILQSDAGAGSSIVEVPTDAAKIFSSSRGEVELPFEAIVGYGYRGNSATSFDLVSSGGNNIETQATITGTGVSLTFGEGGDSHLVIDFKSSSAIFTQPAGPLAGFIRINSINSNAPTGVGTIQLEPFSGSLKRVRWQAPGESYGGWVTITFPGPSRDISSGGYVLNVSLLNLSVSSLKTDTFNITSIDDNRNSGIHKIVQQTTGQICNIIYGGLGCSQPNINGVSIIKLDHKTIDSVGTNPSQNGEVEFDGIQLRWHEPSDTFGSWITVTGGGYFRLFSNNGKWIDVLVDQTALPGSGPAEIVYVGKFLDANDAISPSTLRIWSFGEKVKVIGIVPGVGTEDWQLESPLKADHSSNMTIYRVGDMLPLVDESEESFGNLIVDIDESENPGNNQSDTVQIEGSNLPDGWLDTSTGSINFTITSDSLINKSSLHITGTGIPIIEKSILFEEKDIGLLYTLKVLVRSDAPDGTPISFKLGFDFGSGFIESGNITVNDPDLTMRQPALLEFSQSMPSNAIKFTIKIERIAGTDYDFILERVTVVNRFTALFLGNNTIPRSDGRSNFGSLFYVWSSDELTTEETNLLGLGSPSDGIIAEIHNAHEQIDSFDVSDIVGGNVVNVRGAVNDTEWNLATLINLEVVPRAPDRFSFVRPLSVSEKTETLVVSQSGPHIASLSVDSDENKQISIIYENGIPLPDDQWQFNSSIEIEIISGFIASAEYVFTYGILTRLEIAPIDLQLPSNNGNDTWFVDYLIWNRHESEAISINGSISIFFNTSFEATLSKRSDGNKFTSILTEDTGTTRRTIPQIAWDYLDNTIIKMDSIQFNPDAIYSFQYNQQLVDPQRVVGIVVEVRSAPSVFTLSSTAYSPISINNFVDGALRYHQIRITLSGIVDLRDIRVHSAIIKGLRLNSSPLPPGL